jgi:hypothetical protein
MKGACLSRTSEGVFAVAHSISQGGVRILPSLMNSRTEGYVLSFSAVDASIAHCTMKTMKTMFQTVASIIQNKGLSEVWTLCEGCCHGPRRRRDPVRPCVTAAHFLQNCLGQLRTSSYAEDAPYKHVVDFWQQQTRPASTSARDDLPAARTQVLRPA